MNKAKFITRTAVLIALLVALQYVTKAAGQFVTGSCVNLILAVSALVGGVWCGAIVAIVSPFFAFLLGIGPALIQIVPGVAVGNLVYVLLLSLLFDKISVKGGGVISVAFAAVGKFAALYFVIVRLLLPSLGLPEAKVAVMSAMFSWPQLVTALIGGMLSLLIVPTLRRALNNK